MRPEHSETEAKTETRKCETEIETETKNLLWDETKNYETETETATNPVKSIAGESNTNRYVLFVYYTHEVNNKPEMDFAVKMISK